MNSPLDPAIQRYQQAIDSLKKDPPDKLTTAQVLEILTTRDLLQSLLDNTPDKSGTQLERINQLDAELRQHASAIAKVRETAGQPNTWIDNFNPNGKAWWWFLEAPKPKSKDWCWNGLSVACLTAALTLIGDIAPRFIVGSPDLLSSFFVTAQGIFGLASAGSILKVIEGTAKQASNQPLGNFKLPQWQRLSASFSTVFLLITIGLRLSLPNLSSSYTQWGLDRYKTGDWSSAEANFQRALKLNPDNEQAHFWLGSLYEDLQNTDAARSQYQLAMQGSYLPAVNNLARLHILNKKNSAAVTLLLKALDSEKQKPLDPEVKQAILKNLGWARFQQKDYPGAEMYLQDAIDLQQSAKLKKNIAAAHCLLAQVMEAQGNRKGALSHWETCNQNANGFNPDEDDWAITAQKKLATQGTP
jgi:tetratricopeptide (TPR) repeat protein